MRASLLALVLVALVMPARGQGAGDCPYPVLFLHGYTGSQASWEPFTSEPDVVGLWGPRADLFHAVLNAVENEERIGGADGVIGTTDDDVLVTFANETNTLAPGCVYAYNWENFWNEDPGNPLLEQNSGDSPGGFFASESDSNEEAAQKQGYALGRMIEAVLAANPGKERVILVGHSMGGLVAREYLQRRDGSGTPMWWVEPLAPGGHRVARLLTVGTPHRGSNLFGNPFRPDGTPDGMPDDAAPEASGDGTRGARRDGTPDINSAAVRDLRYDYFCFFCDAPGPYLFGGDEGDIASGFHTDDVDLDGDETSLITGINIDGELQGFSDPWDGTTDNPAMPLPTDVRYTWLTSDVGTSGDLVVNLSRQWIFDASGPVPSDGVPYRLADSLLTDVAHLDQQEDTDAVARGLDEPDYPVHAYGLAVGPTYAGMATVRSSGVPDGAPTTDPDWYTFESAGGSVTVDLAPAAGLGGRLDVYSGDPGDHHTSDSPLAAAFAPGTASVSLPAGVLGAGTHHVRVTHGGVGPLAWRQPYTLAITEAPVSTLRLTVKPKNAPTVIGAGGGSIRSIIKVVNREAVPQTTEVWSVLIGPDGTRTLGVAPFTVTIGPNKKPRFRYTQRIPASALPGIYRYRVYIGTAPDNPVDVPTGVDGSRAYSFEKLAGRPGAETVADWGATLDLITPPEASGEGALGAPSPNPFAARTVVPFTLDAPAEVTLDVVDALGRRVARLASGAYAEGEHRALFDARGLAPGTYVVRLTAGGRAETRRVLLVR